MQRTRLLLLVFALLFSQIILTMHVVSHHDNAKLCEMCVAASHQDHAIESVQTFVVLTTGLTLMPVQMQAGISQIHSFPYSVRAPPQYL